MSQNEKLLNRLSLPLRGSRPGYTLIELLVVIGIIAIIAVVAFTSLDTGNDRERTRAVKDNLTTDLKAQQENSLANKVNTSGNPASYYGILFPAALPFSSYSLVRLEKYPVAQTYNCAQTNCNMTVVSRFTIESPAAINSVAPVGLRAILFSETYGVVSFYNSLGLIVPAPSRVTVNVNGSGTGSVTITNVGAISFVSGSGLDHLKELARGK